eukprot:315072-Pleurochrysis_carterae.AAC.1
MTGAMSWVRGDDVSTEPWPERCSNFRLHLTLQENKVCGTRGDVALTNSERRAAGRELEFMGGGQGAIGLINQRRRELHPGQHG